MSLENYKGLADCKTEPMDTVRSRVFLQLCLTDSSDLKRMFKDFGQMMSLQIIQSRLEYAGWSNGEIDVKPIFFAAVISLTPGEAVMWAYTLCLLAKQNGNRFTWNDFCKAFASGLPTPDAMEAAWDAQKGSALNLPIDNGLDSLPWPKP